MKYLSEDDSGGYISPASDEMSSQCSKVSSEDGLLVCKKKFEITFEVSDLIVVSGTKDSVKAIKNSIADEETQYKSRISKAYNGFQSDNQKRDRKSIEDSKFSNQNKTNDYSCVMKDIKRANVTDADDAIYLDTVELELVVQDEKEIIPNLSKAVVDGQQQNTNTSCDIVSSSQDYLEIMLPTALPAYPGIDSEQSGYISPDSSEEDERKKRVRFKNTTSHEYDSTGYVSSISDDTAGDEDSISLEQSLASLTNNIYLLNIEKV